MIKVVQGWDYIREACDCCDGWWEENWTVYLGDEELGFFTCFEDAEPCALELSEKLLLPISFVSSECPE